MAIIGSFEVTIVVDERACIEHIDDEIADTANSKSTYIEATPATRFKIQLEIMPGFDFGRANYLRWEIFLDGTSIMKPLCFDWAYRRAEYWQDSRGSQREKQGDVWVERKFYFAHANIREPQASDTKEEISALKKVLGTIKVAIHRRAGGEKRGLRREPAQMIGAVPKKAVNGQAITLSPTLGKAERAEQPTYYEGQDVDAEPVAQFVFKYRTKEALKQLLVIPRTWSPQPLEREIDDMNLDDVREFARRQKDELEAARVQVKREKQQPTVEDDREETISGDEVEVTASWPVKGRSQLGPDSVVIDLSD